jgi:hypothetical protein
MNRVEMQQWLEQFPEDTVIEVGVQEKPEPYQSYGAVKFGEFNAIKYEHYELLDFTGNQFISKGSPYFGKRFLQLGSGW